MHLIPKGVEKFVSTGKGREGGYQQRHLNVLLLLYPALFDSTPAIFVASSDVGSNLQLRNVCGRLVRIERSERNRVSSKLPRCFAAVAPCLLGRLHRIQWPFPDPFEVGGSVSDRNSQHSDLRTILKIIMMISLFSGSITSAVGRSPMPTRSE